MNLSKDNITLINLIKLQQAFGVGSLKAVKIYGVLKENNLLSVSLQKDILSSFVDLKDANKILNISQSTVNTIINDCIKKDIFIVTPEDNNYPERLRNICDMPLVLYIKGDLPDIDKLPVISVVGPRKISEFGKKAAFSLAKRVSKAGMLVVSGAALGADTFAHKGALATNSKTIAVLGCGICYDYLAENRVLRENISKNGCLVSEHPPYAPATKYSFPVRNRIISGLSLGTVVIEASLKSGSLITARLANEQGRDVFVIPGNPTHENYKGSNALLRDGAIPLLSANDIFNQYLAQFPEFIDVQMAFAEEIVPEVQKKKNFLNLGLSNEAKIVYNNLNKQKFTVDDLIDLDLGDDQLLSALTELEMEGLIKSLPGGIYETNNN